MRSLAWQSPAQTAILRGDCFVTSFLAMTAFPLGFSKNNNFIASVAQLGAAIPYLTTYTLGGLLRHFVPRNNSISPLPQMLRLLAFGG